jgi:Protein of unknown function (DUF2934)
MPLSMAHFAILAKLYQKAAKQDAAAMNDTVDEDIRKLAKPLWESAAQPYGMAVDFWLMAEQMIIEAMAVTSRMQSAALTASPPPDIVEPLETVPVARVRALAECMWESAGRQYGMAQDFWLAAERHVLAMIRATQALSATEHRNYAAAELVNLPPSAYLERIRMMAYYYWEATGKNYGQALDYWLQAEREILDRMGAGGERKPVPPETPTEQPEMPAEQPATATASRPKRTRARPAGKRTAEAKTPAA